LWCQKLQEKGWAADFEKMLGEAACNGFSVMLCSPWQQELFNKYGDAMCLDSTHNTYRGPSGERMFLNTILVQDLVTGRGVPLALLITNYESQ
ncbi:hypothetical protein BU17DRAFT_49699, partial [Hysterangium stoloniferum]